LQTKGLTLEELGSLFGDEVAMDFDAALKGQHNEEVKHHEDRSAEDS
jgi:hypothetical protein